jgi:hypothetical protein
MLLCRDRAADEPAELRRCVDIKSCQERVRGTHATWLIPAASRYLADMAAALFLSLPASRPPKRPSGPHDKCGFRAAGLHSHLDQVCPHELEQRLNRAARGP